MPLDPKPDAHMNHPVHHEHPHDNDNHDQGDHHDCPDHFHRCHTRTVSYGYMDCPNEDCHQPKMVPRFLTVECGADDPKPQMQAYVNMAGNSHDLVKAVVDLGHKGWLVVFDHPE